MKTLVLLLAMLAVQAQQSCNKGHHVTLTWNASATQAVTYSVYRGAVHGGPYASIASGLGNTAYYDSAVTVGQTYYYVVTASCESSVHLCSPMESVYSNEAAATVP